MMYISFAWTTPAFLKGIKIATRRQWNDEYARRFYESAQRNNMLAIATDKNLRFKGKPIGLIRLTQKPFRQPLKLMTQQDIIEEGNLWKDVKEFIELFGDPELRPYVIKFQPILMDSKEFKEIFKNNEHLKKVFGKDSQLCF